MQTNYYNLVKSPTDKTIFCGNARPTYSYVLHVLSTSQPPTNRFLSGHLTASESLVRFLELPRMFSSSSKWFGEPD